MKILLARSKCGSRSGLSYLGVLIPVMILGAALAGYIKLVGNQNYASMRSQSWNISLVMAECGVEEALAHLAHTKGTNMNVNGWAQSGNVLTKRTFVTSNQYYDVIINVSNIALPVITATGSVPAVVNFVQ